MNPLYVRTSDHYLAGPSVMHIDSGPDILKSWNLHYLADTALLMGELKYLGQNQYGTYDEDDDSP